MLTRNYHSNSFSKLGLGRWLNNLMNYSILIPYQHSSEREPLLQQTISRLFEVSGGSLEICVHEVGSSPNLSLPSRCKYAFTKYSGVFHRAWAINRGVQLLCSNEMLVLMDGDLLVN